MKAEPITAVRGLSLREADEVRLGRLDWTPADYREAGRREYDDLCTSNGFKPGLNREHYASHFVQMFCPPSKLGTGNE